ncbi:MAG: rhomboid family intramembrane serine protease [Bacteroidota bacterium]
MLDSIWKDIKKEFSYGNMVTRIILVNVGFFLFVYLVKLILRGIHGGDPSFGVAFDDFSNFFSISSDILFNLTHPWVFFTHMFLHFNFFHILWNMLFLYWFGRIVGDFIGDQRILPLYILGGLAGALSYIVFANVAYDNHNYAYGASGAVNAIVVAAAVISPDYIIRLLFLGDVKLKFIAAIVVLLSVMSIADLNNTGGNVAHLGGALFGWFFILKLREGADLSVPVNNTFNKITNFFKGVPQMAKAKKGPRMAYKNPNKKKAKGNAASDSVDLSHQEKIDTILDKIKKSGYESLSSAEKEFLFNASKNN